ncbi:helix-turn-helix domain-containing protein [Acidicapsa ligni]|uniref:helix-turn-helix domain-containing protein n=1 Tax=Acidicapsa ligni TaxID=542300 RepID=UPI0021E07FE9|nr:AraC family transcriptional regulator [Acidicapsa ligni]
MQLPITYGNELAKRFDLKEAPYSLMNPDTRSQIALTRITLKTGLKRPSEKVTPEKAFTIALHLFQPECKGWGTWVDGKFRRVDFWPAGGIGIYDLEADPIALRNSPFDSIHYHLPRTTLNAYTEGRELTRVDSLRCSQGTEDLVLHHLTQMVLPSVGNPSQFCQLFWDHFVLMFCAHVVHTYSTVKAERRLWQGGLAPWQKRRVKEILRERLDGNLKLTCLAGECGLSTSHFARSFKKTFGTSVHRYLIQQRIERAKSLLLLTKDTLTDVALQSGFCDHAAFSRTFGSIVGITPHRWRNEHTQGKIKKVFPILDAKQHSMELSIRDARTTALPFEGPPVEQSEQVV